MGLQKTALREAEVSGQSQVENLIMSCIMINNRRQLLNKIETCFLQYRNLLKFFGNKDVRAIKCESIEYVCINFRQTELEGRIIYFLILFNSNAISYILFRRG